MCLSLPVQGLATTLNEAMMQAYSTNPQIQLSLDAVRAANATTSQSIAVASPQFTGSVGVGIRNDLSAGDRTSSDTTLSVGLSQTIYDGGRARFQLEALRGQARSQQHRLASAEQTVLLNAVTAFMNVLRDEQVVELSENNVEILTEHLAAAQSNFDVGNLSQTDVNLTAARTAAAQAELELNRGRLLNSQEVYRSVVGSDPQELVVPQYIPDLPASVLEAEESALRNHPRMSIAQQNIAAAESALQRDSRLHMPIISANISQSVRQSNRPFVESSNLSAGLTATFTLYDSGKARSQKQGAMITVSQSRTELLQATSLTRQSTRVAYSNWQVATASIEAIEQQIMAAEQALEGVRIERTLGARTTLEVLDAEQDLRTARVNLVTASRDGMIAAYSVLAEMGMLTVENLGLDVETQVVEVR